MVLTMMMDIISKYKVLVYGLNLTSLDSIEWWAVVDTIINFQVP
jgi:hypothetical protein